MSVRIGVFIGNIKFFKRSFGDKGHTQIFWKMFDSFFYFSFNNFQYLEIQR
ncbi:hypothetical protein P872_16020 [Rhodonellum psychrophilum GCM71 = DSM 17998]|uniref:Uncharacterized protein n=1 Tax=Rhodonellum psychrophilum GCM71 = DSM 17998 TaxID=1123057 RepID=U5C0N6_9BACT|nr:hypothetical protein P872_16020 [Rhodonellum psychrophilum GCM71 = DSM 17998]